MWSEGRRAGFRTLPSAGELIHKCREISEGRSKSRVSLAGYEQCPIDGPMVNPRT